MKQRLTSGLSSLLFFAALLLQRALFQQSFVKIMGERFAAGLPSNNPLGHYFDALHLTGYYYTFIAPMFEINMLIELIC